MISRKLCPECGSDDIVPLSGGDEGQWMCKECGYTGTFEEEPILLRSGVDSEEDYEGEDLDDEPMIIKKSKSVSKTKSTKTTKKKKR